MFTITSSPIQEHRPMDVLRTPGNGAVVTFEGRVRNQNKGKTVDHLEYEAYEPLAVKEGESILRETRMEYDISTVRVLHRVGTVDPGVLTFWVGVCSIHREAAFEASQSIVDEVKNRVPIWKKEYYRDGTAEHIHSEVVSRSSID